MTTMTGAYVLAFIWLSTLCGGSDAYTLHRTAKRSAHVAPRGWHYYRYNAPGYEPVTDYDSPRNLGTVEFPRNSPTLNVRAPVRTVPAGPNVVVTDEEPRPTNPAATNPARNLPDMGRPLDPTMAPTASNSNPSNSSGRRNPGNVVPQEQLNSPTMVAPDTPQSALVVNRGSQVNIPLTRPQSGAQSFVPAASRNHGEGSLGYSGHSFVPRAPHSHGVANPGYAGQAFVPGGRRVAIPAVVPNHHHHGSNPTIIQVPSYIPVNPTGPIIINPPAQPTEREPNRETPAPIPLDPRPLAADDNGTPLTALITLLQQIFGIQNPQGVTGSGSSEENGGSSD